MNKQRPLAGGTWLLGRNEIGCGRVIRWPAGGGASWRHFYPFFDTGSTLKLPGSFRHNGFRTATTSFCKFYPNIVMHRNEWAWQLRKQFLSTDSSISIR